MLTRLTTASLLSLALVFAGCSDDSSTPSKDGQVQPDQASMDAGNDIDTSACQGDGTAKVVTFDAEDGQKLEGDLYLGGKANAGAVVLLHMIPPNNTRANYPKAFIDRLLAKCLTVLNIDRRGAGGSTPGTAVDAYTGPKGKLDAKAAYALLKAHSCPVDMKKIVFIGASNGTTTALDFTVLASTDDTLELPAGLVFLTGGAYTETNTRIADHRTLLDPLPIFFVYSKAERAWSAGFESGKGAGWTFKEYDPGDHGTRLFTAAPQSMDDVADWVEALMN